MSETKTQTKYTFSSYPDKIIDPRFDNGVTFIELFIDAQSQTIKGTVCALKESGAYHCMKKYLEHEGVVRETGFTTPENITFTIIGNPAKVIGGLGLSHQNRHTIYGAILSLRSLLPNSPQV